MSSHELKKEILFLAKHHRTFAVSDVQHELNVSTSRQYVWRLIDSLVADRALVQIGRGRWTRYALPEEAEKLSERATARLRNNKALDEYKVYADFKHKVSGLQTLNPNVGHIVSYGFTEMLNNAIDHSQSKGIVVGITAEADSINFRVRDSGIGIFRNLMAQRHLPDALAAIQDLTKGKITTKQENHTGEGIFFTSRIADLFVIESYGYRLRIDNRIPDIFVEKVPHSTARGTQVDFMIDRESDHDLGALFRRYQVNPDDAQFDVTEIKVKLYREGVEYVSRSQAKRLLADLDKFRRIILDFEDVPTVGQGFADEVFRVFQLEHPAVDIRPIHMNEEVAFMINRVDKPAQHLF